MLIMLIFPAIEAFAFWLLLRRPQVDILPVTTVESTEVLITDEKPLVGFKEHSTATVWHTSGCLEAEVDQTPEGRPVSVCTYVCVRVKGASVACPGPRVVIVMCHAPVCEPSFLLSIFAFDSLWPYQ